MKKGKPLLCLVVVILAGSLLSCTKKSHAQEAVSSVETRIYVDDVGRQVELPQQESFLRGHWHCQCFCLFQENREELFLQVLDFMQKELNGKLAERISLF